MEIYKIQNKTNKKAYVGLTVQGWQVRVKHHLQEAAKGCDFKLHRALRKYGVDNFDFSLLETCKSAEELKEREKYWIDVLKLTDDKYGYNMTKGGDGALGRKHSKATIELLREAALNRSSNSHVPVEVSDGKESIFFNNMTSASKALDLGRATLSNKLVVDGGQTDVVFKGITYKVTRRDDLKTDPKPKKLGRDPEQVKAHMEMMQKKSSEARKNDKDYAEKQRKAKADKVKPIYQFDLEGNLIKKHLGARQASEFSDVSRGGIRNCIRCKSHICKKFIWSLTDDQEFINEIINSKIGNLVVG